VNDYTEIQKLYEEGYRGLSYDQGPNAKYDTSEAPHGYSYRKGGLPTGYPGAGGWNAYNAGQAGSYGVGTASIVDEEIQAVEIINLDVLDKLDELLEDADAHGHGTTIYALGELKDHIINLSQGKHD
jgi:hypothetical protein|tara:strand:- start:1076 stop:1456 length:381 start_codon:yes stop_codon:yes gene_type:complete